MSAAEARFVDKSGWPRGPWDDEPDKVVWRDERTGLDCMVRRGPSGALCGYVGVPASHPWHGKDYGQCLISCGEDWCYDHAPSGRVEVHGGLTYAAECDGEPEEGICHLSDDGDHVWWFGFDCAHAGDRSPAHEQYTRRWHDDNYRDLGYVRDEVLRLASQLALAAPRLSDTCTSRCTPLTHVGCFEADDIAAAEQDVREEEEGE